MQNSALIHTENVVKIKKNKRKTSLTKYQQTDESVLRPVWYVVEDLRERTQVGPSLKF